MKDKEQMKIVSISYFVGVIFSYVLSWIKVINFEFYGIISALKVSTILSIWWLTYFNLFWKIPILRKLVYRENLNGTWYGTYESVDKKSNKTYSGKIILRIKQDFLNISVISYTERYTNYSYSEEVTYDSKSHLTGIVYVYSQKENNICDLAQRNGTAQLKVLKDRSKYKLDGEFWTIMGSSGQLKVERISKKSVDSFESGEKIYKKYQQKKGVN